MSIVVIKTNRIKIAPIIAYSCGLQRETSSQCPAVFVREFYNLAYKLNISKLLFSVSHVIEVIIMATKQQFQSSISRVSLGEFPLNFPISVKMV